MHRALISILICAAAILSPAQAFAQTSFGKSTSFNDGWTFVQKDVEGAEAPQFDDSKWSRITVPHDWSVKGALSPANAACTGFLPSGIGWYRKHFSGRRFASDKVYIYFEGVYNRSSVYLNGHLLGTRPSGYNSFMYDLTPYLDRNGDNVLAVRVDHSRIADSRWYPGSGIYRDVWLVQSGETHFSLWGLGYNAVSITDKQAVINVDTAIEGLEGSKLTLSLTIKDAGGAVVAKANAKASAKQTTTLKVKSPHRWDLDDPYLYTLEASILNGKETVDHAETTVGLRTLEFNPDWGFKLNGRNTKVKGVCLHHDAGVLGAAVPDEVLERRLQTLKSLGVNAIRTSHNPQAPVFYDLCDRLGLLVMDEAFDEWEFNKKKWVEGWNVGTPAMDGTADYFEEWCERDVKDMVLRDRNHPCVFLWSIGNEVDYPNDPYSHPILNGDGLEFTQPMSGGYKPEAPDAMRIGVIAKRFTEYVHSIDTSRPVTGALAGVVMSNQTEYPQAVDVVGYNYTESRYGKDHEKYPDRIIYGSENRHGFGDWKAVRDNEHIFGQFLWTGADYLGEAGVWPSRGSSSGLIDLGNFVKPRGHFRAALWSETPVCYIGTYQKVAQRQGRYPSFTMTESSDAWDSWNYEDGQTIHVVCYTNAASARLLLNGKEVGAMTPHNDESGIIGWDIPYEAGTLKAEGFDESGAKVSEYEIKTSGRPYSLKARADKTDIDAGGVVQIVVEVFDEAGIPVKVADNAVTCTVTGGELLGLESGDMGDTGVWTDNVQRVYKGRLIAYVKSGNNPGKISVKFTSPLLKSAEVEVTAHKYTPTEDIQLSDPFILADEDTHMYYMTGTGGMLWKSTDLKVWDGPFNVAMTDASSWMGPRPMIWAAELHKYQGKYYYFATFTNQQVVIQEYRGNKINRRACHVLVSDSPEGPYTPIPGSDETYLPADQPTLDASLWVEDGQANLIFCHEWLQNWNGTVESIRLKDGFKGTEGERNLMFVAFDSPWSAEKHEDGTVTPNKVTDGPYVFKTQTGKLGCIWTSWKYSEYTQGVAYSESGKLAGPWIQQKDQITPPNFGHGMIFTTLDGKRILCCHSHEMVHGMTVRIPAYFLLDDSGDTLKVLGRYNP